MGYADQCAAQEKSAYESKMYRKYKAAYEKAVEALEFYKDIESNTEDGEGATYGWDELWMGMNTFRHDKGDKARQAIKECEEILK